MKTTLRKIRFFRPCIEGWRTLVKALGTSEDDTEVTLLQILDINGPRDAYWVLRCWPYEEYCLLLADVAESVLPFFESLCPADDRPRKAIEAVGRYSSGEIGEKQLACAAEAAEAAAGAAVDAAAYNVSHMTVNAAVNAAKAAAASLAVAAASAGGAANAAASLAAAAASAGGAANAATDEQWRKNEQLMRKFLDNRKGEDR